MGWDMKAIYTHVYALYYTYFTYFTYTQCTTLLSSPQPLYLPSIRSDILGETCILLRSVGRSCLADRIKSSKKAYPPPCETRGLHLLV